MKTGMFQKIQDFLIFFQKTLWKGRGNLKQISFDELFTEDKKEVVESHPLSPVHDAIVSLLESGVTSAIEICEILIQEGKLSNDRFSTNKPKAYIQVCSFLDHLVSKGNLLFVEDMGKKDRIYKFINAVRSY
jgi:hypothetical protein